MASKALGRSLRSVGKQPIPKATVPRRSFIPVVAARPIVPYTARPAFSRFSSQQIRGIKTIDFAGTKETVYGLY